MKDQEILSPTLQIAPLPQLIHHLTVFQRTFLAVESYTQRGDKSGMLFGGWLADALHNVPQMLLHYDDTGVHNLLETDAWLKSFPANVRGRGAPNEIVEDCKRILIEGEAGSKLGLEDDLSDFDLAPEAKLSEYLDMVDRAFRSVRPMRHHGNHLPISWHELEHVWTEAAFSQAAFNGILASVLSPLPLGLVRWSQFHEDDFLQNARKMSDQFPSESRENWMSVFHFEQAASIQSDV